MDRTRYQAFVDRLINRESSGNPNAEITISDGRRFSGLGQFGDARLRDLGMGDWFTREQYDKDPELQRFLLDAHFADIDKRITSNNLDRFVGQEFGGVPLTREGMYAMAHLGGFGGMSKFLTTGGEHNPQDELGTSLMDYAVTFSTKGTPADLPEERQRARKPTARDFALDADAQASEFARIVERLSGSAQDFEEQYAPEDSGPRLTFGDNIQGDPFAANGIPKPFGMRNDLAFPGMPPAMAANLPVAMGNLPVPGGDPAAAAGTAPAGFGIQPGASSTVPVDMGEPVPGSTVSTRDGEEDEEEPQGLFANIAQRLFPKRDDPMQSFKDLIGGIGVGLGQISANQAVDLQPYFGRLAAERQALIDSQIAAQEAAMDQQVSLANAETARLQANIAAQRLDFDRQQFEVEMSGGPLPPPLTAQQIEQYSQDPELKPFMDLIRSPDPEVRKQGVQGFRDTMVDRAQADEEMSQTGMAELLGAANSGATPAQLGEIMTRHGLDPSEATRVMSSMGLMPTSFQRDIDQYLYDLEHNPTRAEAAERLWRLGAGGDDPYLANNIQYYDSQVEEFTSSLQDSTSINAYLDSLENITYDMIDSGQSVGVEFIDNAISNVYRGMQSYLGVGNEDLGNYVSNLEQLSSMESALALEIARPLMKGQGAVTENERKIMLRSLAERNITNESRLEIIERLRVLNKIDELAAHYYVNNIADDFSNARKLDFEIAAAGSGAASQLNEAARNMVHLRNQNIEGSSFRDFSHMSELDRLRLIAPKLTQLQHDIYGEAIPRLREGADEAYVWSRVNEDGSLTLMMNNEPLVIEQTP